MIWSLHGNDYEVGLLNDMKLAYIRSDIIIYNPSYITRFSLLVPWKHESVGLVLSGHQLRKPSDVFRIISTHEGSFVFIIHPI